MSMRDENNTEFAGLILDFINGTLSDDQCEYFFKRLKEDADSRRYYVEFMAIHSGLHEHGGHTNVIVPELMELSELDDALMALAESEKSAVAVDVEKPQKKVNKTEYQYDARRITKKERTISKWALYTAFISSAALLFLLVLVLLNPAGGPVVAVLTDSSNARWSETTDHICVGNSLYKGSMVLMGGFAEITFEKGAKVVLQAPVEFELESDNALFLYSGRLSSVVPKEATGFTVRTDDATVVDYGTEFGVVVFDDGGVETQVFSGEVDMRIGSDPLVFDKAKRLKAGECGTLASGGSTVLKKRIRDVGRFITSMDEARNSRLLLGRNLIVNGDFEKDDIGLHPQWSELQIMDINVALSGWEDDSEATVMPYAEIGGASFASKRAEDVDMPQGVGKYFFIGVENCTVSQTLSVAPLAGQISGSRVRYSVSGLFGGWYDHGDAAELVVRFIDWSGDEIDSVKLGPVTVAEREGRIRFIAKSATGILPVGTESVRIDLNSLQRNGRADSYADNLKLVLSAE